MLTFEKIQKRIDALAATMGDAGIIQPEVTILQKSGGRHAVHLGAAYDTKPFNGENYISFHSDNIDALLSKADAFIASMPDPETKAKQDWQGKLGKVIDEGHALNLPDEVMSPLRQGSQAMTENLLAAPNNEEKNS